MKSWCIFEVVRNKTAILNIPSLFKYRSIKGDYFKFTQDIFINNRIYLPSAGELNDPNEGIVELQIDNIYKGWGNQIEERNRLSTRIFSLTETNKSALMWSHYADGQSGICIKFNFSGFLNDEEKKIGPVRYLSKPAQVAHQDSSNYFDIFLNKEISWEYEKEWRIIAKKEVSFIQLNPNCIEAIYLGPRFERSNLEWLQFWIKNYNPSNIIPIIQMSYASTEYELFEDHELSKKLPRLTFK